MKTDLSSLVMIYLYEQARELRAKWSGERTVVRLPAGSSKTIRERVGERFISMGRYLAPSPALPITLLSEPVLGKQL